MGRARGDTAGPPLAIPPERPAVRVELVMGDGEGLFVGSDLGRMVGEDVVEAVQPGAQALS